MCRGSLFIEYIIAPVVLWLPVVRSGSAGDPLAARKHMLCRDPVSCNGCLVAESVARGVRFLMAPSQVFYAADVPDKPYRQPVLRGRN